MKFTKTLAILHVFYSFSKNLKSIYDFDLYVPSDFRKYSFSALKSLYVIQVYYEMAGHAV